MNIRHFFFALFAVAVCFCQIMSAAPSQNQLVNGLATAGFTSTPPSMDGALNDTQWLHAVPVTGFRTEGGTMPSAEATSLRMLWDNSRLYLAFHGGSYFLARLSNEIASFRKSVLSADNEGIFYDDCFVFVLHDRKSGKIHDIAVNANAVILDSEMTEKGGWASRSVKWQSNATVHTKLWDGYWTAEIAIPWSSLGITPSADCDLAFCAGRYDSHKRESSTWQPVRGGYHEIRDFSLLKLTAALPQINTLEPPNFLEPKPILRCNVSQDHAVLIRHQGDDQQAESPALSAQTSYPPVFQHVPNRYSYSILRADTREVLLQSPFWSPVSSMEPFAVEGEGDVLLNGHRVVDGKGYLSKGLNTFEVQGGTARFTVRGQSIAVTNEKKSIVLDGSQIWPDWRKGTLSIPAGMVQLVNYYPQGLPGTKTPSGYRLVVETSPGLELVGASGCFWANPCTVAREGTGKAIISLPKITDYIPEPQGGRNVMKLVFRAGAEATGTGSIRFHAETPDGAVRELDQTLNVVFLPRAEGVQLKTQFIMMWDSVEYGINDLKLQETLYRALADCGVNCLRAPISYKRETAQSWLDKGIKCSFWEMISLCEWGLRFEDYLKQHSEWQAVSSEGKSDREFCCPQLLKSPEGKAVFSEQFAKWNERNSHVKRVVWDYEQSVWTSRFTCYCPRCLKAFAQEYNLSTVPRNRQEIQKTASNQWVEFNCRRLADEARMLREAIKPTGRTFAVYSGYQSSFAKNNYTIDWKLLAKSIDFAMTGYGQTGNALKPTINALNGTPLVNSMILTPQRSSNRSFPTALSTARILEAIADSSGNGTMIYHLPVLDGRTFSAIAEATRLLAPVEDVIAGRNAATPWKSSGASRAFFFQDGSRQVGIFLNLTDAPANCTITQPDGVSETRQIPPGKALVLDCKNK